MKKPKSNQNTLFISVISRAKDLFKIKIKSVFIPAFVLAAVTQLIGIYLNTMLSMGTDGPRVNNAIGVALLIFAMIIIRCLISGVIMVILYDSVITPDFTIPIICNKATSITSFKLYYIYYSCRNRPYGLCYSWTNTSYIFCSL